MHDFKEALAEQVLENRLLKKELISLTTVVKDISPIILAFLDSCWRDPLIVQFT